MAVGSKETEEFFGELIHRGAHDNGYYYGERAVACNERKYKYR